MDSALRLCLSCLNWMLRGKLLLSKAATHNICFLIRLQVGTLSWIGISLVGLFLSRIMKEHKKCSKL